MNSHARTPSKVRECKQKETHNRHTKVFIIPNETISMPTELTFLLRSGWRRGWSFGNNENEGRVTGYQYKAVRVGKEDSSSLKYRTTFGFNKVQLVGKIHTDPRGIKWRLTSRI